MRKFFALSWLQVILFLALVASTLSVPDPSPWRFVLAGILLFGTGISVGFKLTTPKATPDGQASDVNTGS
ncbi:hypothetical protein [Paenarthrobacter aurescens]|uniref:hypothetical protein n=1 Tax=Paenarthrobacter aurescens TaxID=43663 RepID=UPI0021C11E91|nr:hypothetical protein [Paenarthrobacter aurescens]MCT9868398.1 hypothetical protein [Paenarthrobacter aurescens]